MAFATLNNTITVNLYNCCTCGTAVGLEANLERGLRENKNTWYCPNGHPQVFTGKTEADKLRDELKRKEQELSNKVIEQLTTEAELKKTKRSLKRLHQGVCSCCNRSFANLAEHIKNEHPELIGKEKPKRTYTKKLKTTIK